MGADPEDTRREIDTLRSDLSSAIDEIERRVRGGLKAVTPRETPAPLREQDRPTLIGVVGVVAISAVGYAVFSGIRRWRESSRESQTPRGRAEKRLRAFRHGVEERVDEARKRAILVKLENADSGYVRLVDARLESPLRRYEGLRNMLKNIIWAALVAIFMAVFSVLARRLAGGVWRATVREDPPPERADAAKT